MTAAGKKAAVNGEEARRAEHVLVDESQEMGFGNLIFFSHVGVRGLIPIGLSSVPIAEAPSYELPDRLRPRIRILAVKARLSKALKVRNLLDPITLSTT